MTVVFPKLYNVWKHCDNLFSLELARWISSPSMQSNLSCLQRDGGALLHPSATCGRVPRRQRSVKSVRRFCTARGDACWIWRRHSLQWRFAEEKFTPLFLLLCIYARSCLHPWIIESLLVSSHLQDSEAFSEDTLDKHLWSKEDQSSLAHRNITLVLSSKEFVVNKISNKLQQCMWQTYYS